MSDILIKGMKMPKCCKDCVLFHADSSGFYGCFAEMQIILFDERETKPDWCPLVEVPSADVGKWISVDERLPEDDHTVLVWSHRNSKEYFNVYDHGKWVIMETEDITHWMPLPEPPKEKTDG